MVRDEVYERLKSLKREGESFSDVIARLIEKRDARKVLDALAGSIADSVLESGEDPDEPRGYREFAESVQPRVEVDLPVVDLFCGASAPRSAVSEPAFARSWRAEAGTPSARSLHY